MKTDTPQNIPLPKDPHGLNPRQRKFVELFVSGMDATSAYVNAGYSPKGADGAAAKLQGIARVSEAIAEARKEMRETSKMSRDEAIGILVDIVKSKPQEAAMDNPLCELKITAMGPMAVFPDKNACMDKLAKMLGWFEPEIQKVQFEVIIGPNGDDA